MCLQIMVTPGTLSASGAIPESFHFVEADMQRGGVLSRHL